jgi:hypothetical protein
MENDQDRYEHETGEEALHHFLEYRDGKLFWKNKVSSKTVVGQEAGWFNKAIGYRQVQINNKTYLSHRVIFFLCHGYFPKMIDHINQNRTDNRIENLREANKYINACNAKIPSNNTSGHKGVSFNSSCKLWESYVIKNRVKKNLGYFTTLEEAAQVAQNARKEHHGQYA